MTTVWVLVLYNFYEDATQVGGVFSDLELLKAAMRVTVQEEWIRHDYSRYGPFDARNVTFTLDDTGCTAQYDGVFPDGRPAHLIDQHAVLRKINT